MVPFLFRPLAGWMDNSRSADWMISSLLVIRAPACSYVVSDAAACRPAPFSTSKVIPLLVNVATASGSNETLVSGCGSFSTPMVMWFCLCDPLKIEIFRPSTLKTYHEMLRQLKLVAQEYKSEEKYIYSTTNLWVLLNILPSLFHFSTPVNIVKNKNGVVICMR